MNDALTLFRLQVRLLLRSGMKSGHPAYNLRTLGRPVFVVVILLYLGWLAYFLAEHWLSGQPLVRIIVFALFEPLLTILGSAVVLITFFYSFTSLVGTFTDERNLHLLLLSPVRPALILGERILATSLVFSTILCIGLPALFAIGSAVHTGDLYVPAVVVAIALLPLAPVSLAALVLVALLRWIPPARARTISVLVGTFLGLAFYAGSQLVASSHSGGVSELPAWLPSTWTARLIADVAVGQNAAAGRDLLAAAVLELGLFIIATTVAARQFATGSATYQAVGRRERETASSLASAAVSLPVSSEAVTEEPGTSSRWMPLLRKDFLVLLRDPQYLVVYLYPLAIIAFNAYRLLARAHTSRDLALGTTVVLLVAAVALLVTTSAPGIVNREGKSLILLAVAPIDARVILLEKWVFAAVPPLLLIEAALVIFTIILGIPIGEAAVLVAALAALVIALTGVALIATILWPKLSVTNPRRQVSGTAQIVDLGASSVMCVFAAVLLIFGLLVWHGSLSAVAIIAVFAGLIAVIAAALLTAPRLLDSMLHSRKVLG